MSNPWDNFVVTIDGRISSTDDVVSIPIHVENISVKDAEMSDASDKILDQSMIKFHSQLDATAVRHNETAAFLSEQSKEQFLLSQQLVTAKAAGQLDRDALAKSRLDVASVKGPQ